MKCYVDKTTFSSEITEITNTEILKQIRGQDNRFDIHDYLDIDDEILTWDDGRFYRLKLKERKEENLFFEIRPYKGEAK